MCYDWNLLNKLRIYIITVMRNVFIDLEFERLVKNAVLSFSNPEEA